MKNKVKMLSGLFLIAYSIYSIHFIDFNDKTKLVNNIILLSITVITALLGILIIILEIKEDIINKHEKYSKEHQGNELYHGAEIINLPRYFKTYELYVLHFCKKIISPRKIKKMIDEFNRNNPTISD